MAEFINVKGSNPNYYIDIHCPGHNIRVVTEMPEQLTSGVQSDWESRLPYSLADVFSRIPLVGTAVNAIGYGPQLQALSFQTWMGTSPIEIPLQLHFDHKTSAFEDVYKPVIALKTLAFPVNSGAGFLTPPGPVRASGGYGVTVRIGRMMIFENCIIASANETFDARMGPDGYPIAGDLELTLRTSMVYGNKDFLQAMRLGGA